MKVKIDFSEDCKANGYDLSRPGTYGIYIRKNIFHKWKQIRTYADSYLALSVFKELREAASSINIG